MDTTAWRVAASLVLAAAVTVAITTPAAAQSAKARPSLVGTVGASAFGSPAPVATPIGGLSGRPISRSSPAIERPRPAERFLHIPDAPMPRAGVVVDDAPTYRDRMAWTPTAEPPTWRRDPRVRQVDGWRDLIVTDVVCTAAGACRRRELPVRAAWVARCGCYAFADGWNRLWRVE